MNYKKLHNVRGAVVLLADAMLELGQEIEEKGDTEAALEAWEVSQDLASGLERLVKFDIRVAERKLNGEKRVDKPITVN